MDVASFVGIIAGVSLILSAIFLGGDVRNFVNLPGIMIVFGGTIAATLLTFRFKDVLSAFTAAFFVFRESGDEPNDMVRTMLKLCKKCRSEGLMTLGQIKTKSRFLKKACTLISDSSDEDIIRSSLRTEIESLKRRHFAVQDVFKRMGMYSPAFGMLGTLIGLIQMLSKMQEPSSIGPSMAVALLTTFYGSLLSTLFFLPIAGKLKARTNMQVINLEIMFEGAVAILESNNPSLVYEQLSSYIPRKDRKTLRSMRI